ncbi:cysteine and histidine-rich domain-containing protein 1-like protein [Leptotrombidium deliense]|uniref:Cysteine and histidine-rich domain-containing protein 1-like protein n=1 Tax=Leptotrombidium deliense TaxID=299467 RepID=A0A443SCW2_9ACAR|nr:cysteine and histidine-rich domain-containing protein 1-like protein [Leptotrombidium deliense]
MSEEIQCYNRSCGKKYKESENNEKACCFHPGVPVFHDAYKGWSCCSKKTTDFTEFLNMKGCKIDFHSNVKPPEPEKNEVKEEKKEEITIKPMYEPKPRPSPDIPLVSLKSTIGNSLKPVLEKLANSTNGIGTNENGDGLNETVSIGTTCKRNACKAEYSGPQSNDESCCYHDGTPVFHEGMKFWSCCQRRTTDFNAFLDQAGCQTGKHLWFKPKSDINSKEERSKSCRYDWHQTGNNVVLSIYSKTPIPDQCLIKVNPVKLHAFVTFGLDERKEFELEVPLFGIIEVENSSVTYLNSKVEISLKKAEPIAWKYFALSE